MSGDEVKRIEGLEIVAAYGREVTCTKFFGPAALPDVRVRCDQATLDLVIEIQVQHEDDANGEYPLHDVRACAVCAGDVWLEIYRGNGPAVPPDPQPIGGADG
jgi:hypothetical protein